MDFNIDLTKPVNDWLPTVLYPGYQPGLPDVVLGRLPATIHEMTGTEFKSWILENNKEAVLLQARLAEPLPIGPHGELDFIAGPDSAVRKKGRSANPDDVVMAIYSPPATGWPYLVLTSLPAYDVELERGCYAWEVFMDSKDAIEYATGLLAGFDCHVVNMGPDSLVKN